MSRSNVEPRDFFTECGESNRYQIKEIIGKGSYGVVCSALDKLTGDSPCVVNSQPAAHLLTQRAVYLKF